MIKYCLSCGYEDIIHNNGFETPLYHYPDYPHPTDLCHGPFAETPPPEYPVDLIREGWLPEPSPEELAIYNLIGRMMQFELAEV